MKKTLFTPSLLVIAVLLGACGSVPKSTTLLDQTRSAYQIAQYNPQVTTLARLELKQAGDALELANAAALSDESSEQIDKLAYLAKQKIALAEEVAKRRSAEADVASAGQERDRTRLDMRTMEADRASAKAEQSMQEAQLAQARAAQSDRQAALARVDAAGEQRKTQEAEARTASLEAQLAQDRAAQSDRQAARARDDAAEVQRKAQEAEARTASLEAQLMAQERAAQSDRQALLARDNAEEQRRTLEAEARAASLEAQLAQDRAAQSDRQAALARDKAAEERRKTLDAEAQTARLEAQLADLAAKKTERGLVITLGDVLFGTNMTDMRPDGMRTVQKLAAILEQHPQRSVLIEGFTDSTGSTAYNQGLSERRASAVGDILQEMGVERERIAMRGYGKSFPVADNDTTQNRQLNRRVEIVVSNGEGKIPQR